MKWLIIIVVVVVVLAVVAMLSWLRAVRLGPHTAGSQRPHRLDDSLTLTDPGTPPDA